MAIFKLYTDGASRSNPGPAGAGAVLLDSRHRIVEKKHRYLGEETNNVAEYQALMLGLSMALQHGVKSLAIYLDSELVVKQVQGEYRVKDENLKGLFRQVCSLLQRIDKYTIQHIERALNKEADQLANLAIDLSSHDL